MAKLSKLRPFDPVATLPNVSIGDRRMIAVSLVRSMLCMARTAEKIDHDPRPEPQPAEDPYNCAEYRRRLYDYAATPPHLRDVASLFQWQLEFCGFDRKLVQAVLSRALTQHWWESIGGRGIEIVDDVVGQRLANDWWYRLSVSVSTLDPGDIDAHEVHCWELFASLVNVGLLKLIVFPDEVGFEPDRKMIGDAWIYNCLASPSGELYDVIDIIFDHNGREDVALILRRILKSPAYNNTLWMSVYQGRAKSGWLPLTSRAPSV